MRLNVNEPRGVNCLNFLPTHRSCINPRVCTSIRVNAGGDKGRNFDRLTFDDKESDIKQMWRPIIERQHHCAFA
jgi:hypothetical protein